MRIDNGHRAWFAGSVAFAAMSALLYDLYARAAVNGPKGDTWPGLAYGVVGTAMIVFAALLGARKKMLLLRVGSLAWWMKGHLWLGLLSLLMVLFHGAFSFGGPLTIALMTLLILIVASGLLGAALQHSLPGVMTAQVTHETTREQIDRVLGNLRREAYEMIWAACGESPGLEAEEKAIAEFADTPPKKPRAAELKKPGSLAGQGELKQFYRDTILPFLQSPRTVRSPLCTSTGAALAFDTVVIGLDPALHPTLNDLNDLCEEIRQKMRQIRLHRWLHGWLLIHIPLSMMLLILMLVHAVVALYY